MKLSYCESVTASSISPWCIRKLGPKGLCPGGGVDTESLCGRVKAHYGWDIVTVEVTPDNSARVKACPRCIERLPGFTPEKRLGVLLEDGEAIECFSLDELSVWQENLGPERPELEIKIYVPAGPGDDTPHEKVVWVSWDDEEGMIACSYGGEVPAFDTWVDDPEGRIVEEPPIKFVPEGN